MIKHLLNSVIAKYRDLSRYFAQPRPIIVNYSYIFENYDVGSFNTNNISTKIFAF